jgi:hypothetical protein
VSANIYQSLVVANSFPIWFGVQDSSCTFTAARRVQDESCTPGVRPLDENGKLISTKSLALSGQHGKR